MEPPLPAPRGLVFVVWLVVRVFWLIVLALPATAIAAFVGILGIFNTPVVGLQWLAFGLATGYMGWLAGKQVWTVARGTAVYPESLMRGEISATFGVGCLFALGLAIVWPAFGDLVRKSAEGANKGNLAAMRQLLADHQKSNDGRYPQNLDELIQPGAEMPKLWSYKAGTNHEKTDKWRLATGAPSADTGEWAYRLDASSGAHVYIDCTHTDSRGAVWTAY